MNIPLKKKILILFAIFILAILLGIFKGSVNLSPVELFLEVNRPILYTRVLRVLLGVIVGSGLAVSGAALQAILRNPLAEPYLLGTSSGAGLGAVIAIIIGMSSAYVPIIAFISAILSVILVYNMAKCGNKVPVQSLILCGVIVSIAVSGVTVFLISISNNDALRGTMWWIWGSLGTYDLKIFIMVSIIVVPAIAAIFILSQDLNAMSIGDEEAIHLGIEVETIKKVLFIITSLITAAVVSISGVIGFVGLIIPHMMRLVVGPNHRILIPAACVGAAAFIIICDTISRTVFSPAEIPIGVITAIVGAPIFISFLKKKQEVK